MRYSVLVLVSMSVILFGCAKRGTGADIPSVTPIVASAAPAGLKGSANASLLNLLLPKAFAVAPGLSVLDLQSRFFTTGPTAILHTILPNIDNLINSINSRSAENKSACLSQAPMSYVIHPNGQAVTMYAQCYSQENGSYPGDPAFVQFGVKDRTIYIYAATGAEWQALIVTPVEGQGDQYTVHAYIGLGYSNTSGCSSSWDGCSYGSMEFLANSWDHHFELAVAGMGFGYCGAQVSSDGTNIYAEGSVDMGTSCLSSASVCVLASDGQTSANCSVNQKTFVLNPMGRQATASTAPMVSGNWGASDYPSTGANVLFDGSAGDAIHFGPLSPASGVGSL